MALFAFQLPVVLDFLATPEFPLSLLLPNLFTLAVFFPLMWLWGFTLDGSAACVIHLQHERGWPALAAYCAGILLAGGGFMLAILPVRMPGSHTAPSHRPTHPESPVPTDGLLETRVPSQVAYVVSLPVLGTDWQYPDDGLDPEVTRPMIKLNLVLIAYSIAATAWMVRR